MNNIILTMTSLVLMAVSCQKEALIPNCEGDNVEYIVTFYTDEFRDTPCGLQNVSTDDKVVNLVIKTQADYEKYIACGLQRPAVDFEKYFILSGRYRHNNCALFNNQQVLICNNKIIYKVGLKEQDCHAITDVYYVTVIERKYANMSIEFDVEFIN
jgi:hypothetical protein